MLGPQDICAWHIVLSVNVWPMAEWMSRWVTDYGVKSVKAVRRPVIQSAGRRKESFKYYGSRLCNVLKRPVGDRQVEKAQRSRAHAKQGSILNWPQINFMENISDTDTQMLLTYETLGNVSRRFLHTLQRHIFTEEKGLKGVLGNQISFVVSGSAIAN